MSTMKKYPSSLCGVSPLFRKSEVKRVYLHAMGKTPEIISCVERGSPFLNDYSNPYHSTTIILVCVEFRENTVVLQGREERDFSTCYIIPWQTPLLRDGRPGVWSC